MQNHTRDPQNATRAPPRANQRNRKHSRVGVYSEPYPQLNHQAIPIPGAPQKIQAGNCVYPFCDSYRGQQRDP